MLVAVAVVSPARADGVTPAPPRAVRVPVTAPGETLSAEFCLGTMSPMTITLLWSDGKSQLIQVAPADEMVGGTVLPAASLNFQGLGVQYFIRPNALRYTDHQQDALRSIWAKFPSAIDKFIKFAAVPAVSGVAIYLDDRYAGVLTAPGAAVTLSALTFQFSAGGALRNSGATPTPSFGQYLPLKFSAVAQAGAMKNTTVSLGSGLQTINNIPLMVANGVSSGDIALTKQMKGSYLLECDSYLSRNTFDGMPESQLITVPQAYYRRAWVLFAVDPNPKKDPIMTVRLTRFASDAERGRGGTIADVAVSLPLAGAPMPPNMTQVGSISHKVGQSTQVLPLYLAGVDLPLGQILDLISSNTQDPETTLRIGPYLDFEIVGRCGGVGVQWDTSHKPTGAPSAANIFGVTLERAPAELRLTQAQPGNIFANGDTPETSAIIHATQAGRYTLSWIISDVHGVLLQQAQQTVTLAAGALRALTIPLTMPDLGYYGLQFTLSDSSGQCFLTHQASFALLGQDTREAGYESPYGIGWYGGHEITTSNLKIAGPVYCKAGLRHTSCNLYSEAQMAPWKMTLTSFGFLFPYTTPSSFAMASATVATKLNTLLSRYPHCKNVMIFHEGLGTDRVPSELFGVPPTYTNMEQQTDTAYAAFANACGQFYHNSFPSLKIIIGNDGGTAEWMDDLMHWGYNPQNCDAVGIEAASQTFMPEVISPSNIMAVWMARAVARLHGYPQLAVTGCPTEFTYRVDRVLGAETQADYYVRDILLSQAYQFGNIEPGVLDDPGGSYYNTLWGGSGVLQRSPLCYPKPAYVAIATVTKVLDKATLSRVIPTGSLTVYALEFKRARTVPDYAYAVWAPRGTAQLAFNFAQDLTVTLCDMYGHTTVMQTSGGTVIVPTSAAASYLISPAAVQTVSIDQRSFTEDQPPATYVPTEPMTSPNAWQLVNDPTLLSPSLRAGKFTLNPLQDAEKGSCLELTLNPAPRLAPMVREYTSLQLKTPVPVDGQPATIGLWVKGNSNWGKIYFDIIDAKGHHRRSDGYDSDWQASQAVNFDGWRFLNIAIDPSRSPIANLSPGYPWGPYSETITYPIQIVGITVTMYHQAVDPVEMRTVTPVLCFQGIGAY